MIRGEAPCRLAPEEVPLFLVEGPDKAVLLWQEVGRGEGLYETQLPWSQMILNTRRISRLLWQAPLMTTPSVSTLVHYFSVCLSVASQLQYLGVDGTIHVNGTTNGVSPGMMLDIPR